MTSAGAIIYCEDVTVDYDGFKALSRLNFYMDRRELRVVIGPNGAGKTTLLKILSRVTPPTEGRVFGYGRVIPLLAIGAGFQEELTGRANIFLNAAMYGVSADAVKERLDDIIEFADIGDFIDVQVRRVIGDPTGG